jgi:hypothetical protein
MSITELELLLRKLLGEGVQLHPTSYLLLIVVSLVTAGLGAYFGAYLRRRGENLATKSDFDELLQQLGRQTQQVEVIKSEIARAGWVHQRRWELSRDLYFELLRTLEELRQKGRWLAHAVSSSQVSDPPFGGDYWGVSPHNDQAYDYVKTFADHMVERGTVEKLLAAKAVSGIVLPEEVVRALDSLSDLYNFGFERILSDPSPDTLTAFLRDNLDTLLRSTDETYLIVLRASQHDLLDSQDELKQR